MNVRRVLTSDQLPRRFPLRWLPRIIDTDTGRACRLFGVPDYLLLVILGLTLLLGLLPSLRRHRARRQGEARLSQVVSPPSPSKPSFSLEELVDQVHRQLVDRLAEEGEAACFDRQRLAALVTQLAQHLVPQLILLELGLVVERVLARLPPEG